MIRIKSKKPGFRRGGLAHACEWTEYPDGRFSKKELARLQAEPMLQVEVVTDIAEALEPASVSDLEGETQAEVPATKRKTSRAASESAAKG